MHKALSAFLSSYNFEEGAVLINIPQVPAHLLEGEVARRRGYFAYPPQGLLYLAATLRSLNVKARIVDLNFVVLKEAQRDQADLTQSWQDALATALTDFRAPLVCVSFMFDTTFPYFQEVCRFIKNRTPGACIAAGGVSATVDVERILHERLADCVFSHEGEAALRSFYRYVRGETKDLPVNLSFTNGNGSICRLPEVCGGDVDIDIREEYSLIPLEEYRKVGCLSNFSRMAGADVPFATILTRRGCRGNCTFCGVRSFSGKGVRVRRVEGIIDEMEFLYSRYGVRHFDFNDDDLLFDEKAALDLFKRMHERLPGISWAANNGLVVTAVSRELMGKIEKSGCIGFKIGLETGNEELLKKTRKPITLKKFFEFAEMARSFPSLFIAVNFIMGIPEETFGMMLDSFSAALRGGFDWNNFYMYQHLKCTDLYMANEQPETASANDAQDTALNPVRAGAFKNYQIREDSYSGYDIINFNKDLMPDKGQLAEIWFTFNHISNFLCLPALRMSSEIRLRQMVRWLEVLADAYPDNAAMPCLLYYLKKRLGQDTTSRLDAVRQEAAARFDRSDYWRYRDHQFHFSAFLDDTIPQVDERFRPYMAQEVKN